MEGMPSEECDAARRRTCLGNPADYVKGIASRTNVFFDRATIGYKFSEGDPG